MENAGLCLDRFGLPYIPGSAIKGCARRMATQLLLETEGAEAKTLLLVSIALVFGWGDTDWKGGWKIKRRNGQDEKTEPRSDFWWAMAEESGDHAADMKREELWREVSGAAATGLLDRLQIGARKQTAKPWKDLPPFAGSVSFLPAYPVDVTGAQLPLTPPQLGKLELDVVTCHHPEYYRGDRLVATDDEDPNPVVFPAVSPGHVFGFALAALPNCSTDLIRQACEWLALGLSTFGLGAKTAAGYGWFDSSEVVHKAVESNLKERSEREALEARQKAEKEAQDKAEQERISRKRELEQTIASMTEEDRQDYDLEQMDSNQRLQWMAKIDQRSETEKLAIYRLLRSRNPGLWKELRQKAEHGKQKEKKRFGPLVMEIFKLAKQRKEKMP